METPLFDLIRTWVTGHVGVDITYLVWSIAICASSSKHGVATIKWLSTNLGNSVELGKYDLVINDMLIWIRKQPSQDMLA